MADRKISDLTALTAPAAGDYLPIVDISEASAANKNKRITIEELLRGAPDGTAAAPSIGFESDPNTGIYRPGADQLAISTGGTGRLFVDSTGNVGIGTTSPANGKLNVSGGTNQITLDTGDTATYGRLDIGHFSNGTFIGTYAGSNSASDLIRFGTGGTERARIDSSGRLLSGVSTARANFLNSTVDAQVQIERSGEGTGELSLVRNVASTSGPLLIFGKSRGASVGSNTIVNSGDQLGWISFEGSDGTEFVQGASITAEVDGTPGANDMPGRLVFSTTADGASDVTERMRITSGGALKTSTNGTYKFGTGIQELTHNDTTSTIHLAASNTSFTGDATTISTYRNTTNDTYKFLSCIRQGFAVALEIRDDGDVYNVNGTYGSLSDIKLKENIVDAQPQWDDIKQLRVRNYNFKPETNNSTHKQIGVIAQELETVSPGLVNTVSDRDAEGNDLGTVTKSVNYSVLYMKAVKALQEAMERIETLEAKVAALEAA